MIRRVAALVGAVAIVALPGCGHRSPEDAALRACGEGNVAWVNAENPEAYGCRGSGVEFPNGANN